MEKFNITYVIEGIYGRVTFTKTIDEFKNRETLLKETTINELDNELFSFWIECYEYDTDAFHGSTEVINGLPLGITEDMYYKMAMLQNNKYKKHSYNLDELVEKLDMLTDNKIRLLLGCK